MSLLGFLQDDYEQSGVDLLAEKMYTVIKGAMVIESFELKNILLFLTFTCMSKLIYFYVSRNVSSK